MTTNRTTRGAFPLWLLVALAALAAPAAVAAAQTAPPAAQQAADLLAQFPADSGAERDRLAAGLVALGEPGLAELTRQLVPMGTGNDIAVRWALNAVAVYASRTETNRTLAEAAFVKALAAATAAEVRHDTENMTTGAGFSAHMHRPDLQMPLFEGAEDRKSVV